MSLIPTKLKFGGWGGLWVTDIYFNQHCTVIFHTTRFIVQFCRWYVALIERRKSQAQNTPNLETNSRFKSHQGISRDRHGVFAYMALSLKETYEPEFVENWKLTFSGEYLSFGGTGWRRLIGSPELQIIFHKRATKYRSLLWKMTYKDKGSYESSPPCTNLSSHFQWDIHRHSLASASWHPQCLDLSSKRAQQKYESCAEAR